MHILRKFGLKTAVLFVSSRDLNFLTTDHYHNIMRVSLVTKINKFVYMEMFNAVKNTRKLL